MMPTERTVGYYWRQNRADLRHWICLGVILCLGTGCLSLYLSLLHMSSSMKNYRRIFQTEMESVMSREHNILNSITLLNLHQENALKKQMASVENLISQVEVLFNDIEIVAQMFKQTQPRSGEETDTVMSFNELPELSYKAEHTRRRIETIIGELWNFVDDQLNNLKTFAQFDNDKTNSYQDGEEYGSDFSLEEIIQRNEAILSKEGDNTGKLDSAVGVNTTNEILDSEMGGNYNTYILGSKIGANYTSDMLNSKTRVNHTSDMLNSKIRVDHTSDMINSKMGVDYTSNMLNSKIRVDHTSDMINSKIRVDHTSDMLNSKIRVDHTTDMLNSKIRVDHTTDMLNSKIRADHTTDMLDSTMGADHTTDMLDSTMGADHTSDMLDSTMGADHTSDMLDSTMGADHTTDMLDSTMGADHTTDMLDSTMGADHTSDMLDSTMGADRTTDMLDSTMAADHTTDMLNVFKNTIQYKVNQFKVELGGYRRTLSDEIDRLKQVDHADKRRLMMSKELGNVVQNRLDDLQNPNECNALKTVICDVKACGFGCQFHHMIYCLITAYANNKTTRFNLPETWRTLFESVNKSCKYKERQIDDLGEPLNKGNTVQEQDKNADNGNKQNDKFTSPRRHDFPKTVPLIEYLDTVPDYIPLSIPEDLAPVLTTFHGNPAVWWVGQIASFLFKPTSVLKDHFRHVKRTIGFQNPIVGVHVRRTDKIYAEAAFHHLEEYMHHVEDYYDQLQRSNPNVIRRVFLATDDYNLLSEARSQYHNYTFISDNNASRIEIPYRGNIDGLKGITADIYFLSRSDFLVCTFSSQVCRLAYELMQTIHGDASQYFRSLDDIYYFGGQSRHKMTVLEEHKADPKWPDAIDLMKGDTIWVQGNHWNGFSKGINNRTGLTGLYPSYKVEDHISTFKVPASSGNNVKRERILKAMWAK